MGREENNTQRDIAKQNNETSIQIARENNQTQLETLHQNQTWQEMMWNKENEYNSIGAQIARAQSAGLSPYSILDGGAGTAQSPVPNSSSSGIQSSMPSLSMPGFTDTQANKIAFFNYVSSALKNIADTGYQGINQYNSSASVVASINSMMSEQRLKNAETVHQLLENDVYANYGGIQAEANVNAVQADIVESNANADLARAKKAESEANEVYLGKKSKTEDELRAPLVKEAEENVKLVKEKQKTEQTQQESNRASAKASRSQADFYDAQTATEEQARQHKIEQLRVSNEMTRTQIAEKCEQSITMYLDEHENVHVNKQQLEQVQRLLLEKLQTEVDQGKQDLHNPVNYVGAIFNKVLGGQQAARKLVK